MRVRHYMGIDAHQALATPRVETGIVYDTSKVLNSHAVICGMSGSGKSFQCKRMLDSAAAAGIEVDIFDVHEELEGVNGASCVKYSQATGYGFNPLVLDQDRHTGGVTRKANEVIALLSDVAHLGIKQESCLRALLVDTYAASGIFANSPGTWSRKQITERQHEDIVRRRAYGELREYYPTLPDLQSYAMRKLATLALGGDEKAMACFEEVTKTLRSLNRANSKFAKATSPEESDKLEAAVELAKGKYNEACYAWTSSLKTGKELDDIIRYDSVDVLKGLMDRIEALNSAGIFRANEPPFGGARVRVHQIKSLTDEQQVLFVRLRLRQIFEKCKKAGATRSGTELRHLIFLDEGHKFFGGGSGEADIVGIIAKESRKFGLGLWAASQSPTDFPSSFLSNVGLTMLLGIAPLYWRKSASMLRAGEATLAKIKAKETMAVKMQTAGEADPPFVTVAVPNKDGGYACKLAITHQRRALEAA